MMKGSTGTSITLKAMNMALPQIEDQETKREDPASAIEMMVGTEGRGMMTETRTSRAGTEGRGMMIEMRTETGRGIMTRGGLTTETETGGPVMIMKTETGDPVMTMMTETGDQDMTGI